MSTATDYDYTAEDNVPVEAQDDLTMIAIPEIALQSADQIEKDNLFIDIEPGEYLLKIKSVDVETKTRSVTLNGDYTSFTAPFVQIRFCKPDAENETVQDGFYFPPTDPAQHEAYLRGCSLPASDGGKPGKPGFDANKYAQFSQRVEKKTAGGAPVPIKSIRDFQGALVIATVRAGRDYEGRDGQMKKGYPSIAMFTYRSPSDPKPPAGPAKKAEAHHLAPSGRAALPGQQSLPLNPAPAPVVAPRGMDAI